MPSRIIYIILTLMLTLCSCSIDATATSGAVFEDFNGPAGSRPDPQIWGYALGSGLGNPNELEVYTNSSSNVRLDGQGHLILEAHKTSSGYTSGRIQTKDKLNFGYGTITARIKMPSGQGIWPAFWLVGADEDTTPWPQCGEIDIIELVSSPTIYYTTLHGPISGSSDTQQAQFSGPIADLSTDYHDYWVKRIPDSITVGIDNTTLGTFTPQSLPPDAKWVYNRPMYALLNIAVGGDWPGPPTDTTPFPATMLVDWLRFTPDTP